MATEREPRIGLFALLLAGASVAVAVAAWRLPVAAPTTDEPSLPVEAVPSVPVDTAPQESASGQVNEEGLTTPSALPSAPARTRSAETLLVLDVHLDDYAQVGPATWERRCCSFEVSANLSDEFGGFEGGEDSWVRLTLIKDGAIVKDGISVPLLPGFVEIYEDLSVGNWVLRISAETAWGQTAVVDRDVTIVKAVD